MIEPASVANDGPAKPWRSRRIRRQTAPSALKAVSPFVQGHVAANSGGAGGARFAMDPDHGPRARDGPAVSASSNSQFNRATQGDAPARLQLQADGLSDRAGGGHFAEPDDLQLGRSAFRARPGNSRQMESGEFRARDVQRPPVSMKTSRSQFSMNVPTVRRGSRRSAWRPSIVKTAARVPFLGGGVAEACLSAALGVGRDHAVMREIGAYAGIAVGGKRSHPELHRQRAGPQRPGS